MGGPPRRCGAPLARGHTYRNSTSTEVRSTSGPTTTPIHSHCAAGQPGKVPMEVLMGTTTCKDWRPDLPAPALQSSHHRPLPGSSRLYHLQCPPLSSAAPPRGAQPPHCLRAHAMPKSRLIYGTIPTRTAPAAYRPPRVYLRRSRVRSPLNRTDRVACGCVQVSGARAEAPGGVQPFLERYA